MKYPVLRYKGDEVEEVVVLLKGQEYTMSWLEDDDYSLKITPDNEIIEAIFNDALFEHFTFEFSDERLFKKLQDALEIFEKRGNNQFLDPKFWEQR